MARARGDLSEDVAGLYCPDKRLQFGVMHSDVFVDGCLQFDYAGEGTTTNAFVCDVAKEPLDHVELGRTGGCEMDMKAWVLGQPSLDLWVLVGCVVIHDQGGLAKWQSVLLEILAR